MKWLVLIVSACCSSVAVFVCVSLQPVCVFSSCSKQAMCIKVLPWLFSTVTPPTQPEGVVETGTNPAAGMCLYVCGCVSACGWVWVCVYPICCMIDCRHTTDTTVPYLLIPPTPASTPAPVCSQVSLPRGSDPQRVPCKTSLQLRQWSDVP